MLLFFVSAYKIIFKPESGSDIGGTKIIMMLAVNIYSSCKRFLIF